MKLQNPKDVNVTDNTISVLLAGGLGNMMFQDCHINGLC